MTIRKDYVNVNLNTNTQVKECAFKKLIKRQSVQLALFAPVFGAFVYYAALVGIPA